MDRIYPYILMVLVVIFYAGNILIGKAINDLPPMTIALVRLIIAFVVVFPIGWKVAWKFRYTFWQYKLSFLVMTLAGVTFFNTFIYGALQFTSATNVSVLETAIPVMTVVFSAILLKERLRGIQWIGILFSFFGATWVVLDGKVLHLAAIDWNIGDGIMIGAIISWAIYTIYVKRYMHLFPSMASLLVMTGISVIILFPIVVVEWLILGIPSFHVSSHGLGLLYIGIFPSFIALVLYNRAVTLLNPSQASVFLNFLPVVTMIGAYVWLGETISFMQIIGSVIVISGVILTTQFTSRHKRSGSKMRAGKRE